MLVPTLTSEQIFMHIHYTHTPLRGCGVYEMHVCFFGDRFYFSKSLIHHSSWMGGRPRRHAPETNKGVAWTLVFGVKVQ